MGFLFYLPMINNATLEYIFVTNNQEEIYFIQNS